MRSNQLKSQAFLRPPDPRKVRLSQTAYLHQPLHASPNIPAGFRYTRTAIGLHWLIAIALAGSFALGLYMHELPLSPQKLKLYSWHKWAGVRSSCSSILRLAWRLGHRPPALPAGCRAWQRWWRKATTCCSTC
jgi:hypothetical protein